MTKEAYIRECTDYGWDYKKVKLTGFCKIVTGGPYKEGLYYQVKGLLWNRWVHEDNIKFFDPIKVTYHKCKCVENKND